MSVLIERRGGGFYRREDAVDFVVNAEGYLRVLGEDLSTLLVYAPGAWAAVEILEEEGS